MEKVNKHFISIVSVFLLAAFADGREFNCKYIPGRLLVKFKEGITPENSTLFKQKQANTDCKVSRVFKGCKNRLKTGNDPFKNIYALECKGDIGKLCDLFEKTGLFEYVEPDYLAGACATQAFMPNDRYFYRQWALHNDGAFNMGGLITPKPDADIDMPEAWDIEQGDSTLIIAILDSGCKMNHPELGGRIWRNPGEIPNNGVDDDNNGFIDDVYGWDFVNNDNDPRDDNGHGTRMAGVIGANGNNEIGFAGVNLKSKLMIIKVMDDQKVASNSNIVKGLEYAIRNGARVINMSYAAKTPSETEKIAIEAAFQENIIMCGGTGNNTDNIVHYPAAYEQVFAVGAMAPSDVRWTDSNIGEAIDMVAPGDFIFILDTIIEDKYNIYGSGTSYATAFTTGVASLLLSQDPTLTPTQIMTILRESAEDQVGDPLEDTPGWDKYYGAGRLNAYNALQRAAVINKLPSKLALYKPEHGKMLFIQKHKIPAGNPLFTISGRILNVSGDNIKIILPGGVYLSKY